MYCDFTTTTYGKCIIAGEHAVIRGHSALVFPIKEKQLHLNYSPQSGELSADYAGHNGADMHLLFWSVLEHGQHLLGQSLNRLSGHFHLDCNIPIGVGMGASAALCVAMARWFAAQKAITTETIPLFAKNLEDLFHGKSSGLDIAGVAANEGLLFKQGKEIPLHPAWKPFWYLSSSGQLGITSHCIKQVSDLWQNNQKKGEEIDLLMQAAVDKCKMALKNPPSVGSQNLLAEGINEANYCFNEWGLISDSLAQHMQLLVAHGACAVKPTGSGNGGYVISLWDKHPELPFEVIPIN